MSIAWYPIRVVDWCFGNDEKDEDEKTDLKKLWLNLI